MRIHWHNHFEDFCIAIAGEVGVDHHGDEALEVDFGGPAQHALGLGGVTHQQVHLRGAHEPGVLLHELAPVEAGVTKRHLAELLHAVRLARGDDNVFRVLLLQHQPHGPHVVAREAPVALGVQVAQPHFAVQPQLDARHRVRDLAGDELQAAARALVVEEDAGDGEQVVALAVVDGDPVAVDLGDAVGAAGVEGGVLDLGDGLDLAEHLGGAGLVEAGLGADLAQGVQHARDADAGELARQHGLVPGGAHEALGRQVVDLVGPGLFQRLHQALGVQQVARQHVHLAAQMRDALVGLGAAAAGEAVDLVAFFQQQLREVAAVLAGDAGDERALRQILSPLSPQLDLNSNPEE